MPDSRYLCLYLPHLATDRTRRGQAAPGQTLVLTSRVGSSLVVEGVDAQAARLGARPGMSLAQAQAIVP